MEDKREWKDYSSAEKLIAIDAYLSGMTKLDDSDETANGERLQWIREHLPAYDLSGGKNYIFISYSHRDYKQVFSDLAYFSYNSQTRVRFWYDEGLPVGEDWEKAAGGFMADPHCVGVVFYLSKNLLLSPSVFKEIQTVKSLKKPYCTVALDAGQYSAAKIFDNTLGRELRAIAARQDELEEFFPDTHTSLIYGRDNAASRITKISDIFDVTEEVLSDFICEEVTDGMHSADYMPSGLRLIRYAGNKTEVFIPSQIDGKPITEIKAEFKHAVKIHIPKFVQKIFTSTLKKSENLEEIKVDKDNAHFYDINGVLCVKDDGSIIGAPVKWDWRKQFASSKSHRDNKSLVMALNWINMPFRLNVGGYEMLRDYSDKDVMNTYEMPLTDVADIYATMFEDNLPTEEYVGIFDDPIKRYELYKEAKRRSVFKGIKKIRASAFEDCKSIDYLFLPDSITEISEYAFRHSNINLIFLSENVSALKRLIFLGCTNLNTVLTDFDAAKYGKNLKIKGLAYLFGKITYIDDEVFRNTSVQKVIFNDKINHIGEFAFYGCGRLKKITIPGSVRRVADQAFADCTLLREVVMRDGVERIEWFAFANCMSLRKITIPATVKAIGLEAFLFCDSVDTVCYGGTQSEWNNIIFGKNGETVSFDAKIFKSDETDEHRKFTLEFTDGKLIEFI